MSAQQARTLKIASIVIGIILGSFTILGTCWGVLAVPQINKIAAEAPAEWYDEGKGKYVIRDDMDDCIDKKLKPLHEKMDILFDMGVEKLPPDKRYEYKARRGKVKEE